MDIAVSPYHITTREAPAMAALLIGSRVLTAVPAPIGGGGVASARRTAEEAPAYRAFVRAWAWTEPLWREGVLASDVERASVVDESREVARRIGIDPEYHALRALMHEELDLDEPAYLNAVAADLLKGGPDPAILLPISAGIDRFAARHGMLVARSHASSVAQKAELRLGRGVRSIAVPVFLQADAERLLHARDVLNAELDDLRSELGELSEAMTGDGAATGPGLDLAARAYVNAFETRHAEVMADRAEDDVRAIEGTVAISLLSLPSDAVLRSSLAALGSMGGGSEPAGERVAVANLPAVYDASEGRRVVSMVVKAMGGR